MAPGFRGPIDNGNAGAASCDLDSYKRRRHSVQSLHGDGWDTRDPVADGSGDGDAGDRQERGVVVGHTQQPALPLDISQQRSRIFVLDKCNAVIEGLCPSRRTQ